MKQTLYDILGVPPDASDEQIELAHQARLAAAETDPDSNRRGLVNEAHCVLSNARQRAAYDASLTRLATVGDASRSAGDLATGSRSRAWIAWLSIGLGLALGLYAWQAARKIQATRVAHAELAIAKSGQQSAAPADAAPTSPADQSPEDLYARLSGSVALVVVADGNGNPLRSGSGVVIDAGALITNCHVIKGSSQIKVKVAGKVYDASPYTTDEVFDLCRLNVTGLSAAPVSMGKVSALRTGQKVYAIGAPHGLELTISDGIVSSLRETPTGTYIQTTAPISPGSSGGGLFTATGQLVGVVTFQHRLGQNLNFAVPADWIADMRDRAEPTGASNESSADGSKKVVATTGTNEIVKRIVGAWHCFRPAQGRHMDLTFQADGTLAVRSNGKQYQGNFQVVGKVLTLYGTDTLSATIDEVTERRMILSVLNEKRMACDRQS